jgi:hypothetical protein
MKKIAYYIGAVLMTVGTITSCSLDTDSMTEKDTSNFPKTEKDISEGLAAVYQNLNAIHAYPQESFEYYSLLACDDELGGGGTNDKLMQAEDLICNYNTNMTEDFWKLRYEGINRANTLLTGLDNVTLDEATKAQTIGEAKFLRAFYYYELASMYGVVPMKTVSSSVSVAPTTAADVWGQILQDLYEAATTMPATNNKNNGHVDKYCAEAMLGRAWLFYTGMYGNGDKLADLVSTSYNPLSEVALPNGTKLTKKMVSDLIDDCVNNSGYSLVSDFRELWAYTNRYTVEDYSYTKGKSLVWCQNDEDGSTNDKDTECMFDVKFNKLASWSNTIGYANGIALQFGVRGGQAYANTFPFGQGWGAGPVAPNIVTAWTDAEPKDMRREASIQNVNDLPGYTKGGWADFVQETNYYQKKIGPISCKNDGSSEDIKVKDNPYICCFENLMYGTKGWLNDPNNMQTNNIHDQILIRFADVLLMQSELEENISGINAVRKRAGLDVIGSYSLAALQNERRWELAFEGTRWNDIRRWHIAAAALDKQLNQATYYKGDADKNTAHNGGYSARYNATAGFQKIPENQLSLNSNLTQNAGWTSQDGEYNGWK